MNDKEILELLHDFVRGDLTGDQAREIETRVAASASLREELERVRAYYGAIDDMEPVRASDDFLDKVHERIEARARQPGGLLGKLFFPIRIKIPLELAGIAASFLLIVFLYAPYVSRKPQPSYEAPATVQPVAQLEKQTLKPEETTQKTVSTADDRLAEAAPADIKAQLRSAPEPGNEPIRMGGRATRAAPEVKKAKNDLLYRKDVAEAPAPAPAPKPVASAFAPEQEAASGAIAKKGAPAKQPLPVEIASTKYGQSPIVEEERKTDGMKTGAVAMAAPAASAPASAMNFERDESAPITTKTSTARKAKEELSSSIQSEIVIAWSYAPPGKTAAKRAAMTERLSNIDEVEKSKKAEVSASGAGRAQAMDVAEAKGYMDDAMESERDALITGLIDKYNASVMGIDSGNVKIQHIFIATKYLPDFLKQLKKHGTVAVTGKIPSKRSAEAVTIILRTIKK